eukprot:9484808-Pyramimonas_sp.AAC.1
MANGFQKIGRVQPGDSSILLSAATSDTLRAALWANQTTCFGASLVRHISSPVSIMTRSAEGGAPSKLLDRQQINMGRADRRRPQAASPSEVVGCRSQNSLQHSQRRPT